MKKANKEANKVVVKEEVVNHQRKLSVLSVQKELSVPNVCLSVPNAPSVQKELSVPNASSVPYVCQNVQTGKINIKTDKLNTIFHFIFFNIDFMASI